MADVAQVLRGHRGPVRVGLRHRHRHDLGQVQPLRRGLAQARIQPLQVAARLGDGLCAAGWWPVFRFNADTDYPERMNAAVELVDRHVREGRGERIAIRHRRDGQVETVTYAQLAALVNRIAHVLVEDMRLVPGSRVLLRGPNNLMMAASWLATLKAGLVAVPTMPLLRAKELKQIIDKAQVGAALCDARLREELDANQQAGGEFHCPSLARTLYFNDEGEGSLEAAMAGKPDAFDACDTASDDVCLIAFTSGTTGQPKGTMHFHRDVLAMCDLFPRHVLRPQPDDVFCGTPPIAFTFGLGGMLCFPLRIGASAVLAEKLTPETLLGLIQDFRATIVFTAPTFYRQMATLAPRYDLSSLKKSVSAGEALPDATRQSWKAATGIEMTDGIGGTEMMHIFISSAGARSGRARSGGWCPAMSRRSSTKTCSPCRRDRSASWRCRGRPAAATWTIRARPTM